MIVDVAEWITMGHIPFSLAYRAFAKSSNSAISGTFRGDLFLSFSFVLFTFPKSQRSTHIRIHTTAAAVASGLSWTHNTTSDACTVDILSAKVFDVSQDGSSMKPLRYKYNHRCTLMLS
jgi:hypothetical protein